VNKHQNPAEVLLSHLMGKDENLSRKAAESLEKLGLIQQTVSAAVELLRGADPRYWQMAVKVLRGIGTPEALQAVEEYEAEQMKRSQQTQDKLRRLKEQWEADRQTHGWENYLIALYNLNLPQGKLSPEQKKQLCWVIWGFLDLPTTVRHFMEVGQPLYDPSCQREIAVHEWRAVGVLVAPKLLLEPDRIGYITSYKDDRSDDSWWNSSDFKAFQQDYQHLCKCITFLVEGESDWEQCKRDLHRLEVKLRGNFISSLCIGNRKLGEKIAPGVSPIPIFEYMRDVQRSGEDFITDFKITPHLYFALIPNPNHSVSDALLYRAYRELIETISHDQTFRRCSVCGKIFLLTDRKRFYHQNCRLPKDRNRKREQRQRYYERLAVFIAGWLSTQQLEYEYKAGEFDEHLGVFVRKEHDPDFSLDSHQVGVEFQPERLNPYLEAHGYLCKRKWKRKQYHYTFEELSK